MCVLSWHLSWCSHFLLLLEMTLEQFDFLIIVLPLWNYPHGCLQLGLFGHWVVTLQTEQTGYKRFLHSTELCSPLQGSSAREHCKISFQIPNSATAPGKRNTEADGKNSSAENVLREGSASTTGCCTLMCCKSEGTILHSPDQWFLLSSSRNHHTMFHTTATPGGGT